MRCCVQWEAEKKEKCFLLLGSNVRGNGLPLIVDELLWMSLFLNGYTLVSGSEGGFMNGLDIEIPDVFTMSVQQVHSLSLA